MLHRQKTLRASALLPLVALLLSGCGGGGDNGDIGSSPGALNQPPAQNSPLSDTSNVADWPRMANVAHVKSTLTQYGREFGTSVALSRDGSTLVVSALPDSILDTAIVETFGKDVNDQWTSQGVVHESASKSFGNLVKISANGNRLLIADSNQNTPSYTDAYGFHSGVSTGVVVVYDKSDTGTWTRVAGKVAAPRRDFDHYGTSIDMSADGQLFVVGGPGRDSASIPDNPDELVSIENSGVVQVFQESTPGTFDFIQQLRAPYPSVNHAFGDVVALSGDGTTLVVLSPGDDSGGSGVIPTEKLAENVSKNSGVLHVYRRSAEGLFELEANLKSSRIDESPEATTRYDFQVFGQHISISDDGNTIAAGATYSRYDSDLIWPPVESIIEVPRGEVTIYSHDNTQWRVSQLIEGPNADRYSNQFGADVKLSANGATLAVGMTGYSEFQQEGSFDAGAVFTYSRNDEGMYESFRAARLPIPERGEQLGRSLSISADNRWLIAGAPEEDSGGFGVDPFVNARPFEFDSGAVYIYDLNKLDAER